MAQMVSPAGNMEVRVTRLTAGKGQLQMVGQIGVWDSQIYFERREVLKMVKMALNFAVIGYILSLPFALLASKVKRKNR